MSAEREANKIFDRLRKARWARQAIDLYSIGIDDDQSLAEHRSKGYQRLAQVYGATTSVRAAYSRDRDFVERLLKETAREMGERSDAMMEAVRTRLSADYLEGPVTTFDPSGKAPPLTGFARSLAAYTVACSDAPYPVLEEDASTLSAQPDLPTVTSNLPAGIPDAPSPSSLSEMRDAGVAEPESGWAVQLPDDWRGWDTRFNSNARFAMEIYKVQNDADLRLAALTRDSRRPPHDSNYDGHPITLLAGRFISPRNLYFLLRSPAQSRNEHLRDLARKIDKFLDGGQKEFRTAFRKRDWETLRPLLEAAKWTLFPQAERSDGILPYKGKDGDLHIICDDIIDELEGWTWSDTIMAVTLVASVALTFVSMGTAGPVAAAALRAVVILIDVAGVAADLIVANNENEQRAMINRFAAIDGALAVAARPENLAARAAIGALSLLIPYALPRTVQALRGPILRHVLRRIPRSELPRAVARRIPVASGTSVPKTATKPTGVPASVPATPSATSRATSARGVGPSARGTGSRATGTTAVTAPRSAGKPQRASGGGTQGSRPSAGRGGASTRSGGTPTNPQRSTRGTRRPPSGRGGSGPSGPPPPFVPNPLNSGQPYVDAAKIQTPNGPMLVQTSRQHRLTHFERLVAGTGGIRRIISGVTSDLRRSFRIEGEILPGFVRRRGRLQTGQRRAPNFNSRIRALVSRGPINRIVATLNGVRVRLGGQWQRLHLWGPGFGDETAAGMMLGPRSVNLEWMNAGVEDTIRGLAANVRSMGGRLRLSVTAEAWGARTPAGFVVESGEPMLHSAQYQFWAELPDGRRTTSLFVDIRVPDPGDIIAAIQAGRPAPRPVVKVRGDLDL